MFTFNKYYKWYFNIINKAKTQNRIKLRRTNKNYIYYESHHIYPKSMGGIEEVLLTAKEHFICHLLLPKMCVSRSDKHKMINALIKMAYSKSDGQDRYTSRSFSVVKAFVAEKNSEMFRGKPKSEQARQNMKGRTGVYTKSKEHLAKIAQKNKDRAKAVGYINPYKGKKLSEERTKQVIAARRAKFNGYYSKKGMLKHVGEEK